MPLEGGFLQIMSNESSFGVFPPSAQSWALQKGYLEVVTNNKSQSADNEASFCFYGFLEITKSCLICKTKQGRSEF
jgi:hypothetical protein